MRRSSAACLALLALSSCGKVIGLEDSYYLAVAGGGEGGLVADNGGADTTAGSSGNGENNSMGGAGNSGGIPDGVGGDAGASPLFAMPDGKLVFERYSTYGAGDSKMYVVTFPGAVILPELGKTYGICSPFNGIFSPDGRYLVVGAVPSTVCPTGTLDRSELDIYILDLDNPGPNGKQRVTNNDVPDEDPQYAPDGKSILFKHNGYIARWVVNPSLFDETCANVQGSYCFKHTGNPQTKPVIDATGLICYEDATAQSNPDGDIYCFNLADGLAGKDISSNANRTRAVGHTNIYDSRPVIAPPYLYFTRWRDNVNKVNEIGRKMLSDLTGAEDIAEFCTDVGVGYEDAFSLGEDDLVVFSTNAYGVGKSDLFVGNFRQQLSESLSVLVPGVNTDQDELGAAFWRAPPAPL